MVVIIENETAKQVASSVASFSNGKNKVVFTVTPKTSGENNICQVRVINEGTQLDRGFIAKAESPDSIILNAADFATALSKLAEFNSSIKLESSGSMIELSTTGASLKLPLFSEKDTESEIGGENNLNSKIEFFIPGKELADILKKGGKLTGKAEQNPNARFSIVGDKLTCSSSDGKAAILSNTTVQVSQLNLDEFKEAQNYLATVVKVQYTNTLHKEVYEKWLTENSSATDEEKEAKIDEVEDMAEHKLYEEASQYSDSKEHFIEFAQQKGFVLKLEFALTMKNIQGLLCIIEDSPCKIMVTNNFLYVQCGYARFICSLASMGYDIEKSFRDYDVLYSHGEKVVMDKDSLVKAIKTVTLFTEKKPCVLRISNGSHLLTCENNNVNLSTSETVPSTIEIGFSGSNMVEIISAMSGNITLIFSKENTARKPIKIYDNKTNAFVFPVTFK